MQSGVVIVLENSVVDELQSLLGEKFVILLQTFRADSASLVEKIGAAVKALDAQELQLQAHSLKGSSSNLGALQVSAVCKRIEDMASSTAGAGSADTKLDTVLLEAMYAELVESHVQMVADIDARLANGENVS